MTRLAATLLACSVFGAAALAAIAVAGAQDEPAPTVTVSELVGGRDVHTWRRVALSRDRTARVQARSLRKLRGALRARVPRSAHGLELGLLCVKQFEGAWTSNTGNGFYGGLQMNREFQRTYGPEFYAHFGTADRWPASVQLAVGMRAVLSGRGFGPWPTTRHYCGL